MVCQAASQTRFRALKHEFGAAGSVTIVVRVIACFQPLRDCQLKEFCNRVINFGAHRQQLMDKKKALCGWNLLPSQGDWTYPYVDPVGNLVPSLRPEDADVKIHDILNSHLNHECFNRGIAPGLKICCDARAASASFQGFCKSERAVGPPSSSPFLYGFDSSLNFEQTPRGLNTDSLAKAVQQEPSLRGQSNRFILFDQDGSTRRMIVPPKEISVLFPVSNGAVDEDLQCRDFLVASGFAAAVPTKRSSGNELSLFPRNKNNTRQGSCNVSYQTTSGSFFNGSHEDTEDIEALLSSDEEEVSTGRSPSDLTEMNGIKNDEEDSCDEVTSSALQNKKRKIDEVDSGELELQLRPPSVLRISETDQGIKYQENFNNQDAQYPNSYGGLVLVGDNESKKIDALSGDPCFPKKSRKEKIRRTVEMLKTMIPGGDSMDTPILLNEAIRHVKLLQERVKLLETSVI